MPWFKVDDNLAFHHKVVAAGNPAIGLWARAGSLCAQQLTDGFIPDHMIAAMGTTAQAKKLVQVGLWDRVRGGYRFHGWAERQPSKADVEAERAAAKERMREYRAKKKGVAPKADPQVNGLGSEEVRPNERRTNAEVLDVFGDPDPSHPIPIPSQSRPDPSLVAAADASGVEIVLAGDAPTAQTLTAEWIDHCGERPPGRVIGQVSKELKTLLNEGIDPDRIRRALAEWNRKGLHPSTLPSVVHEIANRAPQIKGQQATDDMFDAAMARAIERDRSA